MSRAVALAKVSAVRNRCPLILRNNARSWRWRLLDRCEEIPTNVRQSLQPWIAELARDNLRQCGGRFLGADSCISLERRYRIV
jgi:hypothetical protein